MLQSSSSTQAASLSIANNGRIIKDWNYQNGICVMVGFKLSHFLCYIPDQRFPKSNEIPKKRVDYRPSEILVSTWCFDQLKLSLDYYSANSYLAMCEVVGSDVLLSTRLKGLIPKIRKTLKKEKSGTRKTNLTPFHNLSSCLSFTPNWSHISEVNDKILVVRLGSYCISFWANYEPSVGVHRSDKLKLENFASC
jgi:predicted DNA-binding transcriptional regulator AlpA